MTKKYTKQDILDTAEDYKELGKSDEQKRILEIINQLNKKYPSQAQSLGLLWFDEFYAEIKWDGKK